MEHPITPPPELVQQWTDMWYAANNKDWFSVHIARAAAQWALDQRGSANEAELQQRADQELDACCEWVSNELSPDIVDMLRAARRPTPKPPETVEVNGFTYRLAQ